MGGRPGGPAEPATAPSPMGLNLSRWAKRTTKKTKSLLQKRKAKKMLALQPGMDRLNHELSALRDRHVRLQSVQTDLALDLPHSIPLPDGEEIPYGSATRLHIRDPEQESEIYQMCVRPPPNKTVFDGEPLPQFRSSAAGIPSSDRSSGSTASSGGTSSGSGSNLVERCQGVSGGPPPKRSSTLLGRTVRCLSEKLCHHLSSEESSPPPSTSSSRGAAGKPMPVSVMVPSQRCRALSGFSESSNVRLGSVPTVQCVPSVATSDSSQVSRPSTEEPPRSHASGSGSDSRTNENRNIDKSKYGRGPV